MKYYSQYGQDQFIDQFFKQKENGIFLDIGAYDGVFLSNTLFFEKNRKWTGMCIEPNPRLFERLVKNRKSICIEGAITDHEGEDNYLDIKGVEALGGLVDKYDERHLERIEKDIVTYGGTGKEVIKVKCYNINKLLEENNMKRIDYCSIDTEGGEFDIVKTIDFNKIFIGIFTIEDNYPVTNDITKAWKDLRKQTITSYLKFKGFRELPRIHNDVVMVNNFL